MLMVGCNEQTMLMLGDPRQDGMGQCEVSSSYSEPVCHLELMISFWNYLFNSFGPWLTTGS